MSSEGSAPSVEVVARLAEDARALLHELRLRGTVSGVHGAPAAQLCDAGLGRRTGSKLVLTEDGRTAHASWARLPGGSVEETAVHRAYEQFLPLNLDLLRVCSDWQVRPGNVPNDHRDAAYDWDVVDRLGALDDRVGPVLRRLGDAVARFAGYRSRLSAARDRVIDGEHDWFVSPRIDSYHTVWMQLHEDLLLALGRERASPSEA